MTFLKSSFFILFLLSACSQILYQTRESETDHLSEITTTPDRIISYCEQLHPRKDYYGLLILVLDEANTVLSTTGMKANKNECKNWTKNINNILANGKTITLRGISFSLDTPRIAQPFSYSFPKHGTFYSNGRTMNVHHLFNEKGECFVHFSDCKK